MKVLCYYHNDPDGIVSGAIVKKAHPNDEVKLVKADYDYDNKLIYEGYDKCIVVDFSFDSEIMNKLVSTYKENFCWIDHHQSAKDRNPELWNSKEIEGIRSIDNSGCMLTWMHFFPNKEAYNVVKLIEDLDLWKFNLKETKEFIEGFDTLISSPTDEWMELSLNDDVGQRSYLQNKLCSIGKTLLVAKQRRIVKSFEQGVDIAIEDVRTRLINSNHDQSQIGEYCYKDKGYPIAAIWQMKGRKIVISFRSDKIDVGKVAEKLGGGGHKFASGVVLTVEQFYQIFMPKPEPIGVMKLG